MSKCLTLKITKSRLVTIYNKIINRNMSTPKTTRNLQVEIQARKFQTPYERARIRVRRHMCIAQTYLSARRMTTIGIETWIQQEQHEYLSRLIYIFLLQIFTDKMTRDRIEAGPQSSAMETSSWEETRGRKEGRSERCEDAGRSMPFPSPWRHARFVEGKIYPAIVKRNFRRREKYVLLSEAVSWKRYVNSWVSRMYQ